MQLPHPRKQHELQPWLLPLPGLPLRHQLQLLHALQLQCHAQGEGGGVPQPHSLVPAAHLTLKVQPLYSCPPVCTAWGKE